MLKSAFSIRNKNCSKIVLKSFLQRGPTTGAYTSYYIRELDKKVNTSSWSGQSCLMHVSLPRPQCCPGLHTPPTMALRHVQALY
jgi:hypothetical protein